jgi:hypothetical protein
MHVPILALDYLRRNSKTFSYTDELEIWKPGKTLPLIEIDLCCICDGTLTIGEAKTTDRIEGGGTKEKASLKNYLQIATTLGARQFVLATSQAWSPDTIANAKRVFAGTAVTILCVENTGLLRLN